MDLSDSCLKNWYDQDDICEFHADGLVRILMLEDYAI